MTDVVVPAHNEAQNLGSVLSVIANAQTVSQLIVVADACDDSTIGVANAYATTVLRIKAGNKGSAMAAGLSVVVTPDVVFCDADLQGFRTEHVVGLCTLPPQGGMVVGLPDKVGMRLLGSFPPITGERRVPTWVARRAQLDGAGWASEQRINATVARYRIPHRSFVMKGVRNPRKWHGGEEVIGVGGATLMNAPALWRYTFG